MSKVKRNKIILASTSKSRKSILKLAGVNFSALDSGVDEENTKKNFKGDIKNLALILAKQKAQSISKKHGNSYVIGADQILSFNGKIFNKPKTLKEAKKNLLLFRGKTHYLNSATVIFFNNKFIWKNEQSPKMKMRNFSDKFLENYLKDVGKDVKFSAGGYSIENKGSQLFSRIEGDFFSILGLPLLPLLEKLRKLNALGIER